MLFTLDNALLMIYTVQRPYNTMFLLTNWQWLYRVEWFDLGLGDLRGVVYDVADKVLLFF